MECLEFRRAAGAEPSRLSAEAQQHRAQCERCAVYHRQLLAMDATILKALTVPVREHPDSIRDAVARPQRRPARPRWFALAASVAAGVLVGSVLWVAQPRTLLAREVVEHVQHERESLAITQQAVDAGGIERVLTANGMHLRANPGLVTYAMSCPFRGSTVPHLVVQTDSGPVTVLVLRGEKVSKATRFERQGFSGTITAFGPGSIVVLGATDHDLAQVEARLRESIEWTGQ